jgi:alkanesulfonate monooxygenase SsuD/methylene tetrahydromethanopterin reductase-like flavin-dependent oxidoreductase (luciferase family)/predicted kinase
MAVDGGVPDPALVVLVGVSAAGKSSWARSRYRAAEVVASDDLRALVGSGPHDLDASKDAFALLDLIVAGRVRRGLTTVVDTLGLDTERRLAYLAVARSHGLPAVLVVVDTPPRLCRLRNAGRDRPVPARVLDEQLRRFAAVSEVVTEEGWDAVLLVRATDEEPVVSPAPGRPRPPVRPFEVVLQVSRFPWGEDPAGWLRAVALAADEAGFAGLALMDHLIQIPQVGSAWEPIPEPWVTLGMLAGLDTRLRLGTLVTPVTFRPAGVLAKAVATLDAISGGRAFCGIGAGWWEREHHAFGLPFPTAAERLDQLESAIETMRALWRPGTKPYDGLRVALPETTCYPRPVGDVPVIVGGSGERRTLRIAARLADGCNVPSDLETVDAKRAVLHRHCREVGRHPDDVRLTVLDLPVVGADRDEVWERVERLRGRTAEVRAARGARCPHRLRRAARPERPGGGARGRRHAARDVALTDLREKCRAGRGDRSAATA